MTETFSLSPAWTRVADPGFSYLISRPGLRRIVACESDQKPDEYVAGSQDPYPDLLPSSDNSEASRASPAAPLWLRVADGCGNCPIEVSELQDAAS